MPIQYIAVFEIHCMKVKISWIHVDYIIGQYVTDKFIWYKFVRKLKLQIVIENFNIKVYIVTNICDDGFQMLIIYLENTIEQNTTNNMLPRSNYLN